MDTPTPANAPFVPTFHADGPAARDEVHARPVQPLAAPVRLRRVAFAYPNERGGSRTLLDKLTDWSAANGIEIRRDSERLINLGAENTAARLELHTEFASLTWQSPLGDPAPYPAGIGLEPLAEYAILLQMRIDVTDDDAIAPRALELFDPISLCHSNIDGGRAQFATDFRVDADGFTRYELATGRCSDLRRGMIVRRVLEIETYRIMALMGLPTARRASAVLDRMEAELAEVVSQFSANTTIADHQAALFRLNGISERAETLSSDTRYRFAASHAYGDILRRRITRLDEQPIGDHTTVERYLSNRIEPALGTCTAIEKRQDAILAQCARTIDLLGTRIELDVQIQNKVLLDTISETTRNQYKLQTTIETISTIALSYYLLGILSYVLTPVHFPDPFDKPVVIALLAPVVVLLVYAGVRRLRRAHQA